MSTGFPNQWKRIFRCNLTQPDCNQAVALLLASLFMGKADLELSFIQGITCIHELSELTLTQKAEWSLQVGPDFSRHTACMRPVTMCVINKLNLIWYMQVLLYMHKYRSWKIVVVHKNKLSFLTIFPEINYELLIEEDRPHHCYSLLLLLLVWTTHCIFEISIISLCSQQVCLHVCMWERESSVLQKLINMNCPKVKWHDMLLIGCRMNSENLTCVLKSTEIRSSFNHPLVVS